ncbi:hypothetical protein KHP62_14685 [Rhodobacteraceae bacterium NNCM2]|nr:hypothetical protein [Coraliihabitans acroporae]
MKTLISTLTLVAVAGLAAPAFAEDGSSSLRSFKKEAAKARAVGGYGNPIIAIPTAMADKVKSAVDAVSSDDQQVAEKPASN